MPAKLITRQIAASMPPLYSQEDVPFLSQVVRLKVFTPDANWTWLATEGRREGPGENDWLFFGLVVGLEPEAGYWSLSEVARARGRFGLPPERDRFLGRCTMGEWIRQEPTMTVAQRAKLLDTFSRTLREGTS